MKDRKLDHIRICLEKDVEAGSAGFEMVRLAHRALPELNLDEVNTEIEFLGKTLEYPLIIEGITGGTKEAEKINRDLAEISQELGIGFGVGSQRIAIEDKALESTFEVRDIAPDILLIANLGAIQLNNDYGLDECKKAIEMIDADALALHLNPLQEAIQPEGERNFSGLIEKVNEISSKLDKPVIAKEVGSGISHEIAAQLKVDAIDVGGSGGTSWSLVEGYRANQEEIGRTFAGWGIPTADCIREVSGNVPVIGSGGVRSGLDAAKAIALGADCVGIALPVLKAYSADGTKGARDFLDRFITELRIAMFLTGSGAVGELKGRVRE